MICKLAMRHCVNDVRKGKQFLRRPMYRPAIPTAPKCGLRPHFGAGTQVLILIYWVPCSNWMIKNIGIIHIFLAFHDLNLDRPEAVFKQQNPCSNHEIRVPVYFINTWTVGTAIKHLVPSFVRPSLFEPHKMTSFVLVVCLEMRHSIRICGEMSVNLLENRKQLNMICD